MVAREKVMPFYLSFHPLSLIFAFTKWTGFKFNLLFYIIKYHEYLIEGKMKRGKKSFGVSYNREIACNISLGRFLFTNAFAC